MKKPEKRKKSIAETKAPPARSVTRGLGNPVNTEVEAVYDSQNDCVLIRGRLGRERILQVLGKELPPARIASHTIYSLNRKSVEDLLTLFPKKKGEKKT